MDDELEPENEEAREQGATAEAAWRAALLALRAAAQAGQPSPAV